MLSYITPSAAFHLSANWKVVHNFISRHLYFVTADTNSCLVLYSLASIFYFFMFIYIIFLHVTLPLGPKAEAHLLRSFDLCLWFYSCLWLWLYPIFFNLCIIVIECGWFIHKRWARTRLLKFPGYLLCTLLVRWLTGKEVHLILQQIKLNGDSSFLQAVFLWLMGAYIARLSEWSLQIHQFFDRLLALLWQNQ